MRYRVVVLFILLCAAASVPAQVSIGIGLPGVNIGINLPLYPELVSVPGYPVYYAPRLDSNYFFYDGMYWVYRDDDWYASTWYNGPWGRVDREAVPLYVLRIPVRYYRRPPAYFRGWQRDAPPRWGEHWGREWEQHRSGWDKWNRRSAPAPAPLPLYQKKYSHDRYPREQQQRQLQNQNYRYQPKDTVVREHFQQQKIEGASAPPERAKQSEPPPRGQRQESAPRLHPTPPPGQGSRDIPGAEARRVPEKGPPAGPPGKGAPYERNREQEKRQDTQQRKAPAPSERATQQDPSPRSQRQEVAPHPQATPPQPALRDHPRPAPAQGKGPPPGPPPRPEGKGPEHEPRPRPGQEKDHEKK